MADARSQLNERIIEWYGAKQVVSISRDYERGSLFEHLVEQLRVPVSGPEWTAGMFTRWRLPPIP